MVPQGGSSVEECAEAFVDLHPLIGPLSRFSHEKKQTETPLMPHYFQEMSWLTTRVSQSVSQSVADTHSSVGLRN